MSGQGGFHMNRDQLLEYLEHFTSVTDGNRLAELIGRFTLGMGYDYYRFALILPMSMQRPKVVLFNQCPDSWVQAYTENNMLACDPVIRLARKQTLPIYWNRLDERASFLQEGTMDVMGLAAEFGLRNGISFLCTVLPGRTVFSPSSPPSGPRATCCWSPRRSSPGCPITSSRRPFGWCVSA